MKPIISTKQKERMIQKAMKRDGIHIYAAGNDPDASLMNAFTYQTEIDKVIFWYNVEGSTTTQTIVEPLER